MINRQSSIVTIFLPIEVQQSESIVGSYNYSTKPRRLGCWKELFYLTRLELPLDCASVLHSSCPLLVPNSWKFCSKVYLFGSRCYCRGCIHYTICLCRCCQQGRDAHSVRALTLSAFLVALILNKISLTLYPGLARVDPHTWSKKKNT